MNYDALQQNYWGSQRERIDDLHQRIVSRKSTLVHGTVVPEEGDLTLGDGRRLKIAVMFLDISKFSMRDMYTENEQNAMLGALNLFFTEMIKIAEEYGGTVEKNTGDGLMAYFEDNGSNLLENGCKRAIACALTMLACNQYLISPKLAALFVMPFEFRISIEYGWVTIAKLGAPRRFNACVAIGTVANFASKMLKKALPGEIVIGEQAKIALPQDWQINYTTVLPTGSGWVYRNTGVPYPVYKYTGRWTFNNWMLS